MEGDGDDVFETDCTPCDHRYHKACWDGQPEHMKSHCRICGQQTLGDPELEAIGELFEGEIDENGLLPALGRQMAERYLTGAVSAAELKRWSHSASTRRAFGQAAVATP